MIRFERSHQQNSFQLSAISYQRSARAVTPVKKRMTPSSNALVFFLGGHDLEMVTIRDLLLGVAPERFYDKRLAWGAKASAYRQELSETLVRGLTPVFVELANDLNLDPALFLEVDHHGERAGENRPTSLHQVFDLLKLPPERWTHWFDLVAANDWGYIPAMVEVGASQEEIIQVRAADRAAQGITPEEDAEGEQAVAHAEILANGALTVVHLLHSRTATVADRLQPELGGPGYKNLLVYSPDQVNFFGSGELIFALDRKFPGGWYGGALPARGFWGHESPVSDVLSVLLSCISKAA
jgi:hypothetical protein